MTDEKQDLDNLTKHPGWHRFRDFSLKEITIRLENAEENAANSENDTVVANKLRQCIAVKQAIRMLLDWPDSRLKALANAEAQTVTTTQLSRRGDL